MGAYLRSSLNKIDLSNIHTRKIETTFQANQLLYIPVKMPHKAIATENEPSIHFTYAFREISTKASVVDFVISRVLQDINFQENRFEVLMDHEHEMDRIQKISDYFRCLQVEKSAKELLAIQKLKRQDILKHGMRMGE